MLQHVGKPRLTPREERRRTMLRARMRSGSGWSDACILNISSQGLLVYSEGTASPGNIVELRRGGQLVIARVVWRKNQRIGLSSPDLVPVEALISDEIATGAGQVCGASVQVDRRRTPRQPDKSRTQGRALEFVALAALGIGLACWAAYSVHQSLVSPMTTISSALDLH